MNHDVLDEPLDPRNPSSQMTHDVYDELPPTLRAPPQVNHEFDKLPLDPHSPSLR